jgi:hypothetical protein
MSGDIQKIPGQDGYYPYNSKLRYGFERGFDIANPEDIGLAISEELERDKIPSQLLQIYARFYDLGWIRDYGTQCILMSSVLRRILKLHRMPARQEQVILYWENKRKGQHQITGGFKEMMVDPEQIDTHVVVISGDYILDFASKHLNHNGLTNPVAFIASSDSKWSNNYQQFGYIHGEACWTPSKPAHPIIKHWRYEQKQKELKLSREYFKLYQF